MIRINLLGLPKPRKGKRAAMAAVTGAGGAPNMTLVLVVIVALAAGGNYYYYSQLQRQAQHLADQMLQAQRENQRLADIKAQAQRLEKQRDEYQHRVDVITELQKNRTGPTQLLTTIADTVNSTDAVWLNSMKDDGTNINLDGIALNVNAVAELMKNLKKTGVFRNIQIKESFEDDLSKDVQAFVFTLVCEKAPVSAQKT